MAAVFSKEAAAQKAQRWANEQSEPYTTYKDVSGAYLTTELSHFQNNPQAHRGCVQQDIYHPQPIAAPTVPGTVKTKYFVASASEDSGKTFSGKPQVYTERELEEERRKASDATGGNWDICIISEFEIEQDN